MDGRLDARRGEQHRISVRATLASLPTLVPFHSWTESPAAWAGNPEAREFFTAAILNSTVAEEVTNELSVCYERGGRTRQEAVGAAADPAETAIASTGLAFGSNERRNVDMATWS